MGEELRRREKELIYGQPDDSKIWESCGEPVHDVDVVIRIPAKGLQLEAVFQAEALLSKAGVRFDTGYGCGCRDWQFDWSLRGAFVKLLSNVDEDERKRRWYRNRLYQGYSAEPEFLSCDVLLRSSNDVIVIVNGFREKFEETVKSKLARMGAKTIMDKENPENKIGYRLGDDFIRVAFIPDKRY